ncbi:hypothetical protein FB45DRAFT_1007218 [Roridomyces roridus]|uniref:Uncharacterized protein n=1 Tax=Roridomyces roridus TaxID=1738132 RepID=A0AAD7BG76_9AGAR|nr:hypothetical protein FB45DRAFT_1007218 [Roridomyces roridus]
MESTDQWGVGPGRRAEAGGIAVGGARGTEEGGNGVARDMGRRRHTVSSWLSQPFRLNPQNPTTTGDGACVGFRCIHDAFGSLFTFEGYGGVPGHGFGGLSREEREEKRQTHTGQSLMGTRVRGTASNHDVPTLMQTAITYFSVLSTDVPTSESDPASAKLQQLRKAGAIGTSDTQGRIQVTGGPTSAKGGGARELICSVSLQCKWLRTAEHGDLGNQFALAARNGAFNCPTGQYRQLQCVDQAEGNNASYVHGWLKLGEENAAPFRSREVVMLGPLVGRTTHRFAGAIPTKFPKFPRFTFETTSVHCFVPPPENSSVGIVTRVGKI